MYKKLKEAESSEEMREAIESYARMEWDFIHGSNSREFHHPLVRHVMTLAHIRNLSPEDTYVMLAYHALQSMIKTSVALSDHLAMSMRPQFILIDKDKFLG